MSDDVLSIGIEVRAYNATIRSERLRRGLTQKQLADEAGVSMWTVTRLETFRRTQVDDQARRLLRFLGLSDDASPDWLQALELHGTRRVERSVTSELLARPELLGLPMGHVAEEAMDPAELYDERPELVRATLAKLSERERRIIEMRFGFQGGDPLTLEEIAWELDLSRGRVWQLLEKGLARMAELLEPEKCEP